MNTMWSDFAATFVSALVGACVVFPVVRRRRPIENKSLWADTVEILMIALGFSSGQIAYGLYPELSHGIARYLTAICLVLAFVLSGRYMAARLRRRMS
jgi:cation transport ATPase